MSDTFIEESSELPADYFKFLRGILNDPHQQQRLLVGNMELGSMPPGREELAAKLERLRLRQEWQVRFIKVLGDSERASKLVDLIDHEARGSTNVFLHYASEELNLILTGGKGFRLLLSDLQPGDLVRFREYEERRLPVSEKGKHYNVLRIEGTRVTINWSNSQGYFSTTLLTDISGLYLVTKRA